jgi:hypothetical protein
MPKLVKTLSLFSIPYLVWATVVVLVDPYNVFGIVYATTYACKESVARGTNAPLWKIIEYAKRPCPRIVLGDSRINKLTEADISALAGRDYYNFGYGAGTLPEMCETFWYAAAKCELREVYFAVDIDHFSESNVRNRVKAAIGVASNPLLYLVNRDVLDATLRLLVARVIRIDSEVGRLNAAKEEYWRHHLRAISRRYYESYEECSSTFEEIRRVAEYCDREGITVVFVFPPTHIESQEMASRVGLGETRQELRYRLAEFGDVIDLNIDTAFTRDEENFLDPWHVRHELMKEIARQIWCPADGWGTVYRRMQAGGVR